MRRASCIVLTRQGRSTGQDAEVFLIKRSPELKFLGGFHAFAGGGVEDEVDEEAAKILQTTPWISAALRELFEELGILLCTESLDVSRFHDARAALLDDSRAWLSIIQEFQVDPTPFIGTEIGHWITPLLTRFFRRGLLCPRSIR